MARKPILCLDFDGVIHSYTSGWKGIADIPDPIVPGALAFIKDADRFFSIAVFSTRSANIDGRLAMQQYIYDKARGEYGADFGGDVGWIERITFPEHKPPAFISIDDRGYRFEGTWPDPGTLLWLKPWNKS